MTISMALVDYIPVIFFAVSGMLLLRGLYRAMSKARMPCWQRAC